MLESVELELPTNAHSMTQKHDVDVIRLGPKRCLIRAQLIQEDELEMKLRSQSDSLYANATCVSDMYYAIDLTGRDVLQVLSQVTPLNLNQFPVGCATATEIFQLAGMLVHEAELQYCIYVEASYADYVIERLYKCAIDE